MNLTDWFQKRETPEKVDLDTARKLLKIRKIYGWAELAITWVISSWVVLFLWPIISELQRKTGIDPATSGIEAEFIIAAMVLVTIIPAGVLMSGRLEEEINKKFQGIGETGKINFKDLPGRKMRMLVLLVAIAAVGFMAAAAVMPYFGLTIGG